MKCFENTVKSPESDRIKKLFAFQSDGILKHYAYDNF